ncbi:MAG: hypothetical protein RMJ51_03415 [Candidatus Calescibacterium sp.]|nr:hypothetical protein [Candidatus Calescibacterium sp.]MCX7971668.1 hypothetical protein [bacterium]MDW8195274.1 hypothetical protein [Candidatus Calescibacterium sp.]
MSKVEKNKVQRNKYDKKTKKQAEKKVEKKSGKIDGKTVTNELIFKFFLSNPYFRNLDKKTLVSVSDKSKIRNIRKTLKISKDVIDQKKYRFLMNNYCFIKENWVFTLVENNYKKVIVDVLYPGQVIDLSILDDLPESKLVIPRGTVLILVPFDPEISQKIQEYKQYVAKQKLRSFYVDLINYRSLDSINRLIYFLAKYSKSNSIMNSSDELLFHNKKLISYITGNSHEVIVKNFKKLQKMNYIHLNNGKIKINLQKIEQWIKNSRIII